MNKRLSLAISNGADAFAGSLFQVVSSLILVNSLNLEGWQLGVVNSFPIILFLLFNIPAGQMVDRRNPGTVLRAALGVQMLSLGAFFGLFWSQHLSFLTLLITLVFLSISGILVENCQFVISAKFQRESSESVLVSRIVAMDRLAVIVAPLVVAATSSTGAYYFSALLSLVLCAFSLYFACLITVPSTPKSSEQASLKGGPLLGIRKIRSHAGTLFSVMTISVGSFGLAIGDTTVTLLLLRDINMPEDDYALTLAVAGGAGFLAAVFSPRIVRRIPFFKIVRLAIWLQVLAVATFNLIVFLPHHAFPLVILAQVTWAFALTNLNVSAMDFIARSFDEAELGVVMSTMRTITMLFVPIGAILGGSLVDFSGFRLPLGIWLVIVVLLALAGSLRKNSIPRNNAMDKANCLVIVLFWTVRYPNPDLALYSILFGPRLGAETESSSKDPPLFRL